MPQDTTSDERERGRVAHAGAELLEYIKEVGERTEDPPKKRKIFKVGGKIAKLLAKIV